MKEKILELIGKGCKQDGIEIAYALEIPIQDCYVALKELQAEGKIKLYSFGGGSFYTLA